MKKQFSLSMLLLLAVLLLPFISKAGEADMYIGRWALHFDEGMGWLEVRQEKDFLDADLLWRSGSVMPVGNVFIHNGKLIVTRTSNTDFDKGNGEMRQHMITSVLELEGKGDQLVGKMSVPNKNGIGAEVYYIHAHKVPPMPAKPDLSKVKYGQKIQLLGNDLTGWRLLEPGAVNGWKVEKGILINDPVQQPGQAHINYGNLRTDATFEDFNLKLSVNIPEGSNSGVYLRGIYEVQVMDSYGKSLDNHNMGALYSRITPTEAAEKAAGTWQDMDITLCDRHLTVVLNGKKIIDNQPVAGVTGGAMTSDELVPGPIYLQGDHGKVSYKDMVLTPILK